MLEVVQGLEDTVLNYASMVNIRIVNTNTTEQCTLISTELNKKERELEEIEKAMNDHIYFEIFGQQLIDKIEDEVTVEEFVGARQTCTCLGVSQTSSSTPVCFWQLRIIYFFQSCIRFSYLTSIIQIQGKYPRPQCTMLREGKIFNPGLPVSFPQISDSQNRKAFLLITF